MEAAAKCKETIIKDCPNATIDTIQFNVSSLDTVRNFANEFIPNKGAHIEAKLQVEKEKLETADVINRNLCAEYESSKDLYVACEFSRHLFVAYESRLGSKDQEQVEQEQEFISKNTTKRKKIYRSKEECRNVEDSWYNGYVISFGYEMYYWSEKDGNRCVWYSYSIRNMLNFNVGEFCNMEIWSNMWAGNDNYDLCDEYKN
ncbi:hypothetical protein Tco_0860723 [Tanacetum coccineum]|uniref:Uncharacterized protein n=1 Tax=Tanacetum coccineum TaxID=301880 RepID=A0ABQ5BJ52_9ASTR